LLDDGIIGYIITERINLDPGGELPNWREMTDNGNIRGSHVADGNTVVGVSLCVPLSVQGQQIGFKLVIKIFETFGQDESIRWGAFGSRASGYYKHQSSLSIQDYIQKVQDGELCDPVLSFYLQMGFQIIGKVENFIEDPQSCDWGVMMIIDRLKIFDQICS